MPDQIFEEIDLEPGLTNSVSYLAQWSAEMSGYALRLYTHNLPVQQLNSLEYIAPLVDEPPPIIALTADLIPPANNTTTFYWTANPGFINPVPVTTPRTAENNAKIAEITNRSIAAHAEVNDMINFRNPFLMNSEAVDAALAQEMVTRSEGLADVQYLGNGGDTLTASELEAVIRNYYGY